MIKLRLAADVSNFESVPAWPLPQFIECANCRTSLFTSSLTREGGRVAQIEDRRPGELWCQAA
jgi:hypothetical protein